MKYIFKFNKTGLMYKGFGIIINDTVPIVGLYKDIIISFLFWEWSFNLTIRKHMILKDKGNK